MNKGLRITLITVVVLVGAAALLWTGFFFGRSVRGSRNFGYNMMGSYFPGSEEEYQSWNGYHQGTGMMRGRYMDGQRRNYMPGQGPGFGMMANPGAENTYDPLSISEAREAVESYLVSYQNEDLVIEEIMIFDNNAYAIIMEESTSIGAFELLVDPATKEVFPEYGPNMMWNLKYGMMGGNAGAGMMSSRMRGGAVYGTAPEVFEESGELSVSSDDALQIAQRYLDEVSPGTKVSDEITPFYGYYTIDIERDGEITGMISVNGYTSQVFPHTWHGEFIEMVESDHE